MPVRIKPQISLHPCRLDLDSISAICELVERDFSQVTFNATDYVWEIFDEPKASFLTELGQRERLDSFMVEGFEQGTNAPSASEPRRIKLVFNDEAAYVEFEGQPDHQDWLEHFLIDLRKYLHSPSIGQRLTHTYYGKGDFFVLGVPLIGALVASSLDELAKPSRNPYCRIDFRERKPNPFLENIAANLASNVIWLILGMLSLLLAQWIFQQFGVDINPFN